MNDFPRLADGPMNDPAAMLLRSARADKASQVSKDRMRAMLGLIDPANERNAQPARLPALPNERAKRSRKIAPYIPFQHLISPAKPSATRKVAPAVVAFVQVAAIVAALFVRPLPRIDSVKPAAPSRGDEPELSFFVPKAQPRESARAQTDGSEGIAKSSRARREGFGAADPSRRASKRTLAPLQESIVGDEHAGALAEHNPPPAIPVALEPELSEIAAFPNGPMHFQAGMTQPVRISGIDPSYPTTARKRRVEGLVIVRCVVTEQGLAQNCTVLKSPAYLGEAVLSAARSWRFTPMTWQGRIVPVHYVFRYNFKLG